MRILLTGATGYIGRQLIPVLLHCGHNLICCVRDRRRFDISVYDSDKIEVIEVNFLDDKTLDSLPESVDAAFYLIHSMSASIDDFAEMERISAGNFIKGLSGKGVKQVIYLSGIVNTENLSKHLSSRKVVEELLSRGDFNLTTLRAGIIIGPGSASFEIIRDLVEKLPVMIAPEWLNTRSQPIAARNVIQFLAGVLMKEETFGRSYDIGGKEVLTYRKMLLEYARIRNLRRKIFVVPVMTPKLSSYWLYFLTSTSYKLAVNLVESMKVEVICRENNLDALLNIRLLSYEEAIRAAFDKLEQHDVLSSWIDSQSSMSLSKGISRLSMVPTFGCFTDRRSIPVEDESVILDKIWRIGGQTGWYYADWLWLLRGFVDKVAGGVGLRRGRKNPDGLSPGDSLDFWRVLFADRKEKRLLLYAEMKLPGEAWLEFSISNNTLYQTATFRPLGLFGRAYWFILYPVHKVVFNGMIKRIARTSRAH